MKRPSRVFWGKASTAGDSSRGGLRAPWRPRPGDVVVRRRRLREMLPVAVRLPLPRPSVRNVSSSLVILYGFLALVAVGTGLLLLPQANVAHEVPSFSTALFTAASAVTVTGLAVIDTPTYWNHLGQGVIMGLVGVGGLGWMTMAAFIFVIVGQRVSLPQRMALRQPMGVGAIGGIVRLLLLMTVTFLVLQALGGLLLMLRLRQVMDLTWGEAAWQGFFHSLAAFNNAGFSILPASDNVTALHGDYFFLGTLAALIMLGGLSFFVMLDVVRLRRFSRLSLDTKIVVVGSVLLWLLGTVVFYAFETGNDATLKHLPEGERVFTAFFHSVSARTAGFNTVNIAAVTSAASFFLIGLMFIGTASASAGGGIRLNTLGVVVGTVLASIRGRDTVTMFGRQIPVPEVHRAIAVVWLSLMLVFLAAFLLAYTEDKDFLDVLFETVSAFGTVGLSKGITADLSEVGRIIIVVVMLLGKFGPLTMALALSAREERPDLYQYATEHVKIG
ncbi:MAG: Trk family potassium uptake protein [Dehalococcoidia bacterium]|nr:Trk family potassium uptake protein [Dehalococcoidia bacterium]